MAQQTKALAIHQQLGGFDTPDGERRDEEGNTPATRQPTVPREKTSAWGGWGGRVKGALALEKGELTTTKLVR